MMDSDNSPSDEDLKNGTSFVSRSTLLKPFRPLVSKNALTTYLGTFLFFAAAICMIFVSIFAYGVFYYKFIPQIGLERIVHLQFGDGHPWGTATLDSGLISLQPYDVHVELDLPRTPSNLAAGNFMLELTLLSHPSTSARTGKNSSAQPISRSRRPAILTYASPLVDISKKVSFLPLYVLGWRREAESLVVGMMEGVEFARGALGLPGSLRLELHSHEEMQVYAAKVTFRTRFSGLRWIMYQWRIMSFFVFTFLFWSVSMTSLSLSWILLACLFATGEEEESEGIKKEEERESEGETTIKEEPFDEPVFPEVSNQSESESSDSELASRIKRAIESGQDESEILKDTWPEDEGPQDTLPEASGAGTGRESAEALGIQRRRSRLTKEEI